MDIGMLSPEERGALSNLVKSPGWYVLLQHHILPQYQSASHTLDRLSGSSQTQADVCRGIKHTFKSLLDELYKIAELPNPFEQHALALMANLQSYTTPPVQQSDANPAADQEQHVKETRRRATFPV